MRVYLPISTEYSEVAFSNNLNEAKKLVQFVGHSVDFQWKNQDLVLELIDLTTYFGVSRITDSLNNHICEVLSKFNVALSEYEKQGNQILLNDAELQQSQILPTL